MADSDEREYHEERWVFIGIKRGQSVAKVHGYRRPNGQERFWKKAIVEPEILGHVYTAQVFEDGDQFAVKALEWAGGEKADDYENIILDDRAEQKKIAKDQLAKNLKRQDVLKEACEPIVAIAAKVMSQAQRQALIDYVTRAIYNA